ncbi:hypothetical protein J2W94_003173 [Pseudoxanthomonas sacheonensis]|uniref:Secreted protein n=1 Tax=Pseudoxanthomonas sacheonensis TaxID=443615 RepID=A0ABU1RVR1_9GAMM|nr:hypothetical protein [Pseudoxanthomonas sacheonensis]
MGLQKAGIFQIALLRILLLLLLLPSNPVRRGKQDGINPAGAAHTDVRRFRRRRRRLPEIPGLLANLRKAQARR